MAGLGMDIQRLTGADIKSRHWDAFYEFYINTTGDQKCELFIALCTVDSACGLAGSGMAVVTWPPEGCVEQELR